MYAGLVQGLRSSNKLEAQCVTARKLPRIIEIHTYKRERLQFEQITESIKSLCAVTKPTCP